MTGASRGVGKGIALALGAAGATVYVTGRTVHATRATVPLPGTIHETADLVNQAGGTGIAVPCDHRDDDQVRAVFDQIMTAHGRLDLLVNNAWEGYQAKQRATKSGFHTLFWKLPPTFWDTMFTVGVRSQYVASVYGAAIMVQQQHGLIIHLSATAGREYSANARAPRRPARTTRSRRRSLLEVPVIQGDEAVNRMAADMAHELQSYQVSVIALCPGMVATEMIMARRKNKALEQWMETPLFVGRAVVALTTDPQIMKKTGSLCQTRALAQEYGFTDVDGHQPKWDSAQ